MTPPRYIVEEQLAFVTCGAVGRSFRFLPTEAVVQLLSFALAVMARRHEIAVHEVFWMSNHAHLLLTDVRGNLPDFMRDLNSLISRGLNALRGSTGSNIEKGYNLVTPADDDKVVDHAVYALLNACTAGLVERARDWAGVSTLGLDYGKPIVIERPCAGLWKHADGAEGGRTKGTSKGRSRHAGRTKMPACVEFTLVRPPIRPDFDDGELRALIRRRVEEGEKELIENRAASGAAVLGMQRVLEQSWSDTPTTTRVLFDTTPRVSGRSTRAKLDVLRRRLEFEAAYAKVRDRLIDLIRSTGEGTRSLMSRIRRLVAAGQLVVPHGTYLLRRRYGLRTAPGP